MKKLVVLFWAYIAFSYFVKAQCVTTLFDDLYTPMCTQVFTFSLCAPSNYNRSSLDSIAAHDFPNTQQIITYDGYSSSSLFNCHGYAWIKAEGGPDRWLFYSGYTDPNVYISDRSFTEVSSMIFPGKVFWGVSNGDHSAVTTANGVVISKWGSGPLVLHALNDSPYGTVDIKYYVKTTSFSISGPDKICSSGTFTLTPSPKCSIQWSISGPFSITPPDPNNPATVRITYTGANTNNGILTADFNGIIVTKTITLSNVPTIEGSSTVCFGGNTFKLCNPPQSTIYWTVTGPFSFSSSLNVTSTTVSTPTVFRTKSAGTTGTLSARSGSITGTVIASIPLTACPLPVISGTDVVCNSGTYKLSNGPAQSWSVSSGFSITSSSGTSATVTSSASNGQRGTLSAYVDGTYITKDIQACVTISGPSTICAGNIYTFTTTGPSSIIWSNSSYLTFTSSNFGTQVSVKGTSQGLGSLSIVDGSTGNNLGNVVVTINPAAPIFYEIDGDASVKINVPKQYAAIFNGGTPTSYSWSVSGAPSNYYSILNDTNSAYLYIVFYEPATYDLNISASNSCSSDWGQKFLYVTRSGSPYSYYPNPVSDILNIEIDAQAVLNAQSQQPNLSSGTPLKIDPLFDIRIYDGQGNLLRQTFSKGGLVQFNVSSLPDGIYYLHIYDGLGNNSFMAQIVVEH